MRFRSEAVISLTGIMMLLQPNPADGQKARFMADSTRELPGSSYDGLANGVYFEIRGDGGAPWLMAPRRSTPG